MLVLLWFRAGVAWTGESCRQTFSGSGRAVSCQMMGFSPRVNLCCSAGGAGSSLVMMAIVRPPSKVAVLPRRSSRGLVRGLTGWSSRKSRLRGVVLCCRARLLGDCSIRCCGFSISSGCSIGRCGHLESGFGASPSRSPHGLQEWSVFLLWSELLRSGSVRSRRTGRRGRSCALEGRSACRRSSPWCCVRLSDVY